MTQMHEPELPFGHPGRNFDATPAGYSDFDDWYEQPPGDLPEETVVHYEPGNRPLFGDKSPAAIYTDEPGQVAGCKNCLDLVAEDLQDPNTHYGGHCLHCRREITATGSLEWRRAVRRPCPHCGRPGW